MSRFCLTAALVALAAPFAAADDKGTAKYVKLRHVETGKVLAVADGSADDLAEVVLAKEDGKDEAQQWTVEKDGEFLKLINRKSGKVLDVNNDSKDEGAQLIQFSSKDDGNDNQRFSWDGADKTKARRLKSKSSELVLDTGDEGKVVQKKADDKAKSQLFEVAADKDAAK